MRRPISITGVASVVLGLVIVTAHATQIIYQTPKQMGQESSLVVRGKVSGVRSFWNDTRTKVLTETTVSVEETYKGFGDGVVRILQLGGVVDNVRVHVHGAPGWQHGEEVVLFLERINAESYRVSGLSQGKFKVERDPVTGEAFITRPVLDDAELVGAPSREGAEKTSQAVKMPLDKFIDDALGRR
ncbi:MAG: hypothetical protein JSW58_09535 [Candidatus Latescibacterota bacterium]|nr:MAG: hypothetical protein JSW58_09535 [Candidatus Latescibacterota bacterium]